ncbi:3-oxoacyl-ACP synthase III family protein [Nanoarchaeota archaeon]
MNYSKIVGLGAYAPTDFSLTNPFLVGIFQELKVPLQTNEAWILERTGITNRYIAGPDETNATMGHIALAQALEDSHNWVDGGIGVADLDCIILTTDTNPHQDMFPMGATHIQDLLKANKKRGNHKDVPCLDLPAGCSGTNYAIEVADALITSGKYKTMAVVASEKMSSIINYVDRNVSILFGDLAGAMILQGSDEEQGIIKTVSYSDGSGRDMVRLVPRGEDFSEREEYTIPSRPSQFLKKFFDRLGREFDEAVPSRYMYMEGGPVFKFAASAMRKLVRDILKDTPYSLEDVNLIVPHQANYRIIYQSLKPIAKDHSLSVDEVNKKMYVNIDRVANGSAASCMYAVAEAYQNGKIKKGDLVMTIGFGVGLTETAALFRAA